MRFNAVIAGVGMTQFGKHMETGLKALGAEAVQAALADAGIEASALQAAFVGNAAAGLVTGQECIRGQVILRSIGIGRIPGRERRERLRERVDGAAPGLRDGDRRLLRRRARARRREALPPRQAQELRGLQRRGRRRDHGGVDGSAAPRCDGAGRGGGRPGAGEKRSMFMDIYAAAARAHMQRYGTTAEQFAAVAAKNSFHGSMNPRAQFREVLTRRGGAGGADDRRAADAADVLADRRRRRRGGGRERAQGARARRRAPRCVWSPACCTPAGTTAPTSPAPSRCARTRPTKRRASARTISASSNATMRRRPPSSWPTSRSACAPRARAASSSTPAPPASVGASR